MKKAIVLLFVCLMAFVFVSCKEEPHVHTASETIEKENVVAATCQQEGSYDNVVRCTGCNEILSSSHETVAKLPHNVDYRGICSNGNESYCTESTIGVLNAEKQYDKMYYCHFNLKGGKYQMLRNGGNPVTYKKLYKADGTEISFALGNEISLPAGDYYFVFSTGYTGQPNGGVSLKMENVTHPHVYDYKGNCTLDCDATIYQGEKNGPGAGNAANVNPGVYKYTLAAGTYKTECGGSSTGFEGEVYNAEGTKIAETGAEFTVEDGTVVYVTFVAGSSQVRYLKKV